jgi:hypothetical protein
VRSSRQNEADEVANAFSKHSQSVYIFSPAGVMQFLFSQRNDALAPVRVNDYCIRRTIERLR